MPLKTDPLLPLGKPENSDEVRALVKAFAPIRLSELPLRRHLGSTQNGIDLLIEDGRVIAVQMFVQRIGSMSAFSGDLPFGLDASMDRDSIRALLGGLKSTDRNTDHHMLDALGVDLAVNYQASTQKMKYLNVMVIGWQGS